ncbi:hypothetical protein ACLB1G_05870 [Oxalobacteraceae bacterium A2-2]
MKKLIFGMTWLWNACAGAGEPVFAGDPPPRAVTAREIGKIDKELRGKTPPVPEQRDDGKDRLSGKIDQAYIGNSEMTADYYTSPDGVGYIRMKKNGRMQCYISANVNYAPGILHDPSAAKTVNCPPASGWHK